MFVGEPGLALNRPRTTSAVGMFETVDTAHGPVRFPGVPTWFSRTPGRVAGPARARGLCEPEQQIRKLYDVLAERLRTTTSSAQ